MSTNTHFRVIGFAFLCCSLGGLLAALLSRQAMFGAAALPFLGVGIAFLAKSRQPG